MNRLKYPISSQHGFVSIFTVLFFVIFIMVITVGFLRIVAQEQQQSTDNSLSNGALLAARSGVEDAKRVLKLYNTTNDSNVKSAIRAAFNTQRCDGLFGEPTIANPLGLHPKGEVASSSNLQQSYTCLTINPYTDDFSDSVASGVSDLVPLTSQSNFNTIEFSWHGTGSTQEGQPNAYPTGPGLLKSSEWASRGYPALMRLQLISVPSGNFNIDQIKSSTALILPASGGTNSITLTDSGSPVTSQSLVKCESLPVSTPYACNTDLRIPSSYVNTDLYLRITAVYASSSIKMSLKNGGSLVKFSMVQPTIDSTGKTSDVFRRVSSRVRLDGQVKLPEYVLETGNDVCKVFAVTETTVINNAATCAVPPDS